MWQRRIDGNGCPQLASSPHTTEAFTVSVEGGPTYINTLTKRPLGAEDDDEDDDNDVYYKFLYI